MTTGTAGSERFALAMQSALTRHEVAEAYLGNVRQVIDASAVGLYQLEEGSGQVLDVRVVTSTDFLTDYETYGRADDPVLEHVVATRTAIDSSRLRAGRWQPCGARTALARAGYEHSMEAPVIACGTLFGTINFARDFSQAAFSASDLSAAESIAEHLGRAMERSLRFEVTSHRAQVLENTIDRVTQPVIVTDMNGQILFQNRAARQDWPVPRHEDGTLSMADGLSRAIADATLLFAREGRRVVVRTVSTGSRREVVAKTFKLADSTGASATVLFDRAEDRTPDRLPAWDVLTRREQEIARLVSEGLTTKLIAERAFISENTVKQHLKRIFAKTDVTNRAELIQLIWASAASSS